MLFDSPFPYFKFLNFFLFQLWPENPTYQVYVPGYNPSMLRSTTASIQQLQQQQQRSGSISPNTINALMTTDNRVLYAELQFPVTSNYGSMKKRSQRDSVANTTASTSIHSGEPSPTSNIMMMSLNEDTIDEGSMESIPHPHRYVPEYLAISNRKTAV